MAKKKPYRFILYLLCRFAAFLFSWLPRPAALALARGLGRLGYSAIRRHRQKTLENLRMAFAGEKTEAEIQEIAKRVFENFAMTAADILLFPRLNLAKVLKWVEVGETYRLYEALLREGKGIISITAHIGNWELLAAAIMLKGFPGAVLARRIYYEPYNRWIVNLRRLVKVETLYRDRSSREILELLARNEIIGILPDQDMSGLKGIFVDFFGRPSYTPVAPVRLALASGAPILPSFLIRRQDGRYEFILGEILWPVIQTTREEAVRKFTQEWMRQFEKIIRAYPEQWAWMHERWKTKPESAAKETRFMRQAS